MKLQRFEQLTHDQQPDGVRWNFYCPGCKRINSFLTDRGRSPNWTFDGNLERPTFSPSLLIRSVDGQGRDTICHLFLRAGRIEFLGDCTHELRGQTVDLPDIPESERW